MISIFRFPVLFSQHLHPRMASLLPGLRRAVPLLTKDCVAAQATLQHICPGRLGGGTSLMRFIRTNSTKTAPQRRATAAAVPSNAFFSTSVSSRAAAVAAHDATNPVDILSKTVANSQPSTSGTKSGKFFPEVSSKSVAYWLLGSAASVFGIVVFGGLTRLTESGYVQ